MKYRNRGKHGFKRLKRQMQVYDYCKKRISKGDSFQVKDIASDLNIPHSTICELLKELSEKNNDFIYRQGCIKIKGIGNNGYGKLAEDEEGLIVKKMSRTTQTRLEKKNRIYKYLIDMVENNTNIPCLSYLSKEFPDMHMTTLMEVLKDLDKENKIIYKRGQVVAVNVPSVKAPREKITKYNHLDIEQPKEEIKETPSIIITDTERYDKAVKDLIAEYILNADINTKEEIIEYINAIMKITDKLKEKLYK